MNRSLIKKYMLKQTRRRAEMKIEWYSETLESTEVGIVWFEDLDLWCAYMGDPYLLGVYVDEERAKCALSCFLHKLGRESDWI